MGRSNNTTNNMISGESGPAYLPNYPTLSPHHHHPLHHHQPHHHPHHLNASPPHLPPQQQHPGGQPLPLGSPPHLVAHSSQPYLNLSQLANSAQIHEANNNNVTPPVRTYSPLSHGSNSSTGSFVSGGSSSEHNLSGGGNGLTTIDPPNSMKYEYEEYPQEPDGGPVKISTWKDHVAIFNIDQVGVMCDVLLQEGHLSRLVDLLHTVGKDFIGRSEKILRAQAHVAFHAAMEDARKFPQVYKILEQNNFSPAYHPGLQKLWFQAHYKEAEITRGRALGAVDKYRIRRKFPLPRTIWDGEETVYCFKERSRNALRESFRVEKYPNLDEKKKLSNETGLTMTQVGNWFKNKRQREKEKEQGKAGVKRSSKSAYNPTAAIAAAMSPELLGMMLNSGGVSPGHNHPLHPHHHHHHPHQQMGPVDDLEATIKKARMEEARLKSYIDETMYTSTLAHQHGSASAGGANYLHTNNNHSPGGGRQMVLPGKSDITIGVISSPSQSQQSPRPNNGLTITTVSHSPGDHSHHHHHHSPNEQNGRGIDTSPGSGRDGGHNSTPDIMYGGRPRSNLSASASMMRCGADVIPYLNAGGHHPSGHHPHHIYHAHHNHPHAPSPLAFEAVGLAPLIHNGGPTALSHA